MKNLLARGVAAIYPSPSELEKVLASGKKLSVYLGIDPTGPDLHLGHAVLLRKLRQFANLGHQTIIVLGDFTALIGDPSGKSTTRPVLTPAQVAEHLKNFRPQLEKILDFQQTKLVCNSEWLNKLSFGEVIGLASEFTVAQLLERDMFVERQKQGEPIYLHELFYPLMQGYDSVALNIDLEIGGSDQTFNMLVGRTMLKRRGKEKFVLALKLLTDPLGKKMGKTEGNMVKLSDPPQEMYGKIMSWPDSLLATAFELCTEAPLDEMAPLIQAEALAAKKRLAEEIVRFYHGEAAAQRAATDFTAAFQEKGAPETMTIVETEKGEKLGEALRRAKLVASKSDFRRLVQEGAVFDLEKKSALADPLFAVTAPLTLRLGKKRFVKISVK